MCFDYRPATGGDTRSIHDAARRAARLQIRLFGNDRIEIGVPRTFAAAHALAARAE